MSPSSSFEIVPIGWAKTPFLDKASAPRQPAAAIGTPGTLELERTAEMRDALSDLASWKRIWVIFGFHLAEGFRPKVLPPRETEKKRGVLSTRSPHRQNHLGLSALRLERIEDCTLHVLDVDLVDGTPIFDIKPYVAYTDSFPDDGGGWLADPKKGYVVSYTDRALAQLTWLEQHGVALRERVDHSLSLGPEPHAYRRIRLRGALRELAVKEWRVDFRVEGETMRVLEVRSGFREKELVTGKAPAEHLAFVEAFAK